MLLIVLEKFTNFFISQNWNKIHGYNFFLIIQIVTKALKSASSIWWCGPGFLGILCPEVCRVRVVCGEPGAWWRGMNRKNSKAEQPTNLWHLIFSCSLSLSLHMHNTWTSLMHNTVPMRHTNNSKIVSNN
jgi:hypothetical protein